MTGMAVADGAAHEGACQRVAHQGDRLVALARAFLDGADASDARRHQ
jgi:hypothetical protein